MTEGYYLLDWLIGENEIGYFRYLVSLYQDLQCQLSKVDYSTVPMTPEGYLTLKLALYTPSEEVGNRFFQKLASKTSFTNWIPISEEYYDSISYQMGRRIENINNSGDVLSFNSYIDGLREWGRRNRQLREQLNNNIPLYFGCDWIIPPEFIGYRTSTSPIHWHDIYSNSMLYKILSSCRELGIGRDIRAAKTIQNEHGYLGKQMIIRVFHDAELERLKGRLNAFGFYEWYSVDEHNFLENKPLINVEVQNLYYSLERKSLFNGKLKQD